MNEFRWSLTKSRRLKKVRGVSFEEIIRSDLIDVIEHPDRGHQKILVYWYKEYIWVVPYVDEKTYVFLKTLYPSRKYMKIYKEEIL